MEAPERNKGWYSDDEHKAIAQLAFDECESDISKERVFRWLKENGYIYCFVHQIMRELVKMFNE